MSESLRDERVKLYTFSESTTDGRIAPTYTYDRSYWGRRAVPGSREATVAGQASQRVDVVFALPERASIDGNGAIRGEDGTFYKIVGIYPVRNSASMGEQIVYGVNADEQNPNVSET